MTRLVLVELTRLRWRRAVLLIVVVSFAVPLLVLAARTYDTRPPSAAQVAEAQGYVDQDNERLDRQLARCKENIDDTGDTAAAERRCDRRFDRYRPRLENYLYQPQLRLKAERRTSGVAVVAFVAVLMLLAGTTFVGHDWSSGSMSNQLLFESRRLRVWFAKAIAVGLLALVVGAISLVLLWGGLWTVAQQRGLDPSGQVMTDVTQHAVRGLAMIVAAAVRRLRPHHALAEHRLHHRGPVRASPSPAA